MGSAPYHGTKALSYAAQTQVLECFAPAFSASAGPFLKTTATGSSIPSLSCPPSTLALVVEYIGPAPAVYAAPAPVIVYLALAQAVSYAAQAQVLEYFAPAFLASAGPFATATRSSSLSLSCPPSTLALVVEYIAPAPAVYAAPAPVVRYITSAQSVSYAAPARVLSTLCQRLYPMLLIATAIGGFGSGCMLCLVPLSGQFSPHSATPFVITLSDGEIQAVLLLQSGALWHLVACTNPVSFNSTYHLLHFMRGQELRTRASASL